jgi:hypothetical protein
VFFLLATCVPNKSFVKERKEKLSREAGGTSRMAYSREMFHKE